ncbi:unnamed protein product [marine sediment metagenome]|uniref:Uncharacterized protein n=1 Tax=marine sediment metagenome TaxID=412755 RepID=X1BL67_9ZZZZ
MIYIKDNFLTSDLHEELIKHCENFTEYKTPGKSFWVKELPLAFKDYIVSELENIEGKKINPLFSKDHLVNLAICLSAYFCFAVIFESLGLTVLFRRIPFDFVVYII